jgi:alpha-beta hydrolase superfamily lysophospholipase
MDHKALAAEVQKLAGVLVAATVPILGIPSLVFKQFTRNLVGVFTRFFEDITTFAFDPNGERLISLHVDRTVRAIMESDSFNRFNMDDGYSPDSLVVAGHSLGSIVTHSYIVRHREANSAWLPHKVLTFGSPIGLVSWLWLFLDFEDMDFKRLTLAPYFTWAPLPVSHVPPTPIQWINVVNHLDPIATAFPVDYVDLAGSPRYNAATLTGGRVHHRFIRAGDSAGAAHTSYFEDRDGFLEILGRLAGLRPGAPEDVRDPDTQPADKSARPRSAHWQEADTDLKRLSCLWWLGGLAALATYLGGIAYQCGTWLPLLLLPVYGWPCATIGTLAFFQRLLYSKPTKRTSMAAIKALPCDRQSRPHCIRQKLRRLPLKNEAAYVNSPRPGWEKRMAMWVASFIPSLIAMALPVFVASQSTGLWKEGWTYFTDHLNWQLPVALAFFTGYLICFAISEFLRHWRTAISLATK